MIIYILLLVFIIAMALLLYLWIISPGKPRPITDAGGNTVAGSLSEKIFIEVNGSRQGMFIQSRDTGNPVLLYLHGGMPDFFLTQKYPSGMEEYFTVVWWEQRGSGLSWSSDLDVTGLNTEQMISDAIVVTEYLRQRFSKEKIYLMGHSGGTFIGIQTAAKHPELYHAYIGIAQMADQRSSEVLAYNYMLAEYKKRGNHTMVRRLESAPVTMEKGVPPAYLKLRDQAMHGLGVGTTHDMHSIITGIFFQSLVFRGYTLAEKYRLWAGKAKSGVSSLWETMLNTDLRETVTQLDIPVYFFHGIHDYTVSYELARNYLSRLEAPVKGFYTFENSAHSPLFEEPDKMRELIKKDVLKTSDSLADKN